MTARYNRNGYHDGAILKVMLSAVACVLALGQAPIIEVAICDPVRRTFWYPDGKALSASTVRDWFKGWDKKLLLKAKRNQRAVLVRLPFRNIAEAPTVLLQYHNGKRETAQSQFIPTGAPTANWLAIFELPVSALGGKESIELGFADGSWQTTGTQWPTTDRKEGKPFPLKVKKIALSSERPRGSWWLSTNLPEAPRHLDWRLQPYGSGERTLESHFASSQLGMPIEYLFTGNVRADTITRVELQRRPITWVKFAKFDLQGPR